LRKNNNFITSKDTRMIAKGFLEAIFEDKLDFDNEEVNTLN